MLLLQQMFFKFVIVLLKDALNIRLNSSQDVVHPSKINPLMFTPFTWFFDAIDCQMNIHGIQYVAIIPKYTFLLWSPNPYFLLLSTQHAFEKFPIHSQTCSTMF